MNMLGINLYPQRGLLYLYFVNTFAEKELVQIKNGLAKAGQRHI